MPNRQKQKGSAYEREIVNWHRERGIPCERVPLSGAAKGSFKADLRIHNGMEAECKRFANGLGKLYDALEQDGADIVFARQDRSQTLVCMPLETYEALMGWTKE